MSDSLFSTIKPKFLKVMKPKPSFLSQVMKKTMNFLFSKPLAVEGKYEIVNGFCGIRKIVVLRLCRMFWYEPNMIKSRTFSMEKIVAFC